MEIRDEIWILVDHRPGTAAQAIGLGNRLSKTHHLNIKHINLDYSFLAKLPNCFFSQSLLRVTKNTRTALQTYNYLPKIIISSGRRSAPIAFHIKNQQADKITAVHIMHPNMALDAFDYVILPTHDKTTQKEAKNIIRSIGSLTTIDDDNIDQTCKKFAAQFEHITQPKIAVFLGGDSKKTHFSHKNASDLAQQLAKIATHMQATLLIANSRRTGDQISDIVISHLNKKNCDFHFFDWNQVKDNNPYLAIMGYADFIIVTGDSVSMISESCSTQKDVYIFDQDNISSPKQRQFHHSLITQHYAKKLDPMTSILENTTTKKLEETKRISSLIRLKF